MILQYGKRKLQKMNKTWVNLSTDFSFIEVGKPVAVLGKKIVVYVLEILGDIIITTEGTYKKEQLVSLVDIVCLVDYINNNQN
jgi:hypothetical protein